MDKNDDLSPMVSILETLTKSGFTAQFKATKKGLCSMDSQKAYKPGQVEIKHFYRFEGDSSSDDSSILYAIETKDGIKGTLVDSYGAYSDPLVAAFIKEVEAIKK